LKSNHQISLLILNLASSGGKENEHVRVALITLEGGGTSSVCRGLASSLSKKRVPTTIFTEGGSKCEVETVNDFLEIIRLPVMHFPPRGLWFQLRHFRLLSNLLKEHSIVHGVSPDASVVFSFYKNKLKKPFVATIHVVYAPAQRIFVNTPVLSWTLSDFALHVVEHPWHEFVNRSLLANSDHIVACSFNTFNELRATYENLPTNRMSVICNGIDFDEIDSARIDDDGNNDKNNLSIVFAGRLFWLKGVFHLLRAMETLSLDFKNLRLKIFGTGPQEHRIRQFISDRGLKDVALLKGRVPHKQLIAEIKRSELLVLPSLYEAQPMVALEAMACKKPVVAFNAPFVHEIIKNGYNGILAKAFDPRDLSDKICMLLSDNKLRLKLARNAYSYVKLKHNWDLQADQHLKIYESLAK
jgi:glycosyltransferase involved in cell wall biosynthesis